MRSAIVVAALLALAAIALGAPSGTLLALNTYSNGTTGKSI